MSNVQDIINEYADIVYNADINEITTYFDEIFTFSAPQNLWQLKNDEEFKLNLKKVFDGYTKLGAKHCKLLNSEIIHFKSNHAIATLTWGLIDEVDSVLLQFEVTYLLKQVDNQWKYIFVVDHNEEQAIADYLKNK